ncbi:Serine/threonine-protein kinase ppk13 [Trametes pubescens]|uniref:non-specific serine/threonine protein kinase n=1 Tax=Trametes pubescens TaxID=154538 RepID=A0A1M2V7Y2_TRAPU|nr:Serine/threonine-protein kinase ppk13 [Trametes pubescens]
MSLPPQLLHTLEGLKYQFKDAFWALSSCICQQAAKVKINGRTFRIIRVLGEGGFSFVYLVEDENSGRQFALKKIRCPSGNEDVRQAMREVEAYRRFKHPNIIRIMRGNLQDAINANSINNTHFSEREMLHYFKGTCEAIRAMHDYRAPVSTKANPAPSRANQSSAHRSPSQSPRHSEDEDDEMFPHPEGDADGGYSYHGPGSAANVPLMSKDRPQDDVVFDGDEELSRIQHEGNGNAEHTELVPYAHRDLKPGNVMIADDNQPILMDFGSTVKARIKVENRSQALLQQDIAAEQSTMAYRAPELFDVKTGVTLDEKVDIWSLGCTLYALAYSHSPFENTQTTEQGGSIAMAVMGAQYKHPSSAYSQGLKNLIDSMLKVNPQERPDIHEVIRLTDEVMRSLR